MSSRTRARKRSNKVGPRIVRAWFDTVINPLLTALKTERVYLEDKNWTWQFRPGKLESIYHIGGLSYPIALDNLEQILKFYPSLKEAIENHDREAINLLSKCRNLHRAIRSSPALREIYQRLTSPDSLSQLGVTLTDLFGAYPQQDHLDLLAQYIVNNTGDLPNYYTTARLWNPHKEEFLEILNHPSIRDLHKETEIVGERLQQTVVHLIDLLKEKRNMLSLEYDVPPVTTEIFAEWDYQ